MTNKIIIQLENAWKIYQLGKIEVQALRGLNLAIEQGSFVSLIGPSGSGKSTLLNMIGCLDLPTRGRIFLDSQDISLLSENELAKIRGRKIGFVFQQFNLLQNLNALENVMLPMAFLGIKEEKRIARAKNLLTVTGLKERFFHKPTELSGGEQQRVAIARALANDPEVVVADEPTGNLDSSTGKRIMEILKELHAKNKKTIIVVTHDPQIAGYSEEVINLRDGQIIPNHFQVEKTLWSKNNEQ